ncbi:M48 family metallopeptidase [Steroidobacter sp. S1-65]|uniref:M48 family metallopeptidase n=1 Tax=Steroidobacter gossypii TaxID=2805490 RepID=A0ABS1WZN8_9GAMM|nr:M48 family metallopeptidase [Steroidobacter gossypii]MBM0106392.1 M48 family metallopeptidase [Steroidobacter gossypii]
MHWFTALFVLLLVASTAMRSWLNQRQVAAVLRHRGQVPEAFAQQIDLADHQKAADYTVARAGVNRWDVLLDAAVALILTLGGGIDAVDRLWRAADLSPTWHGVAVVVSTFLIVGAIGLPLSLWRTFGIEARFGFNRMTPGLYVADLVKGLVLGLLFGVPLIFVILYLMQQAGALWWLYAWLVWAGFSILVTWAWPAIFAPLFNKFTPVTDEALKQRTEAVLQRCGFESKGVFKMDGSRRSSHGNAYFTGIGRNKRIVFFDTLLERLQIAEVEAVLAHELGHFRLHHIRSRLIVSMVTALLGFLLIDALMRWPAFYSALGVSTPSTHAALLLFMFVLPAFTYFLTPIGAWWSRKHEFEADAFAAQHADAKQLADALVKLYRDNASTLTPDELHSAFYDSHPPALVRIARLQSLATGRS